MKTQIIAEIGKNFIDPTDDQQTVEQCLVKAKRMVFQAKASGATVVKFQTHVLADEAKKRGQIRHSWILMNEQRTPLTGFWLPLSEYCESLGIEFLTTPMSKMAAEKVSHLVKRWKVSSADNTDMELLAYLKSTGKPIILSSGMSTPDQLAAVFAYLNNQIELLNYCISIYPCPIYKINLSTIQAFKKAYNIPIGFSDHSLSTMVPALAVRAGATSIEKHFTLYRSDYGPDHKVSLHPEEFREMVDLCKLAEEAGDNFEEEKKYWENFRK